MVCIDIEIDSINTYAVPYVDTVPDIPKLYNTFHILANIAHRFGHKSGLYESSGQNQPAF